MESKIIFPGVPIPPSSNNQYRSFARRGIVRHVSSPELVSFKKTMAAYFLTKADLVRLAREKFVGYPLYVNVHFAFERSRILTKKGTFKRLDVSNRLKALHDCFADALLIDDSAFVSIAATKHCVSNTSEEGAVVEIEVTDFAEVISFEQRKGKKCRKTITEPL